MSHSSSRWLAVTTLFFALTVSACGSSSGATPPTTPTTKPATATATSAPLSTNGTTAAPASCPSGAKVGAALGGISLPNPVGVAGSSGTPLPAGATGVSCEYAGKAMNVLIELITNISSSYIDQFSSNFPVPYVSVSGVGDQARSFSQSLNGGKDNEGVVATKGSNLVDVTATYTPASLAQIEALINQLL
jgi:hypothetical protein